MDWLISFWCVIVGHKHGPLTFRQKQPYGYFCERCWRWEDA